MRCLRVRVSVTFVSCVKTNKDIFELFSPSGSQAILVFRCQTGWRYSDGSVECRWGRQKTRLCTIAATSCNSLYHKLPNCQLNRLQQIQNSLAHAVVKAPKSTHITPILKSLHWLKVNERIEYKLLSLTYKVLTTAQPSYLHNLIFFLQPPRSTRSSSVVTFSRPPTISSLNITDRLFRYASPRLWNQLPDSFRQPHHSRLDSPPHPLLNSSLSLSPLSSSITPSLFHFRLKTYLFNKSFPP